MVTSSNLFKKIASPIQYSCILLFFLTAFWSQNSFAQNNANLLRLEPLGSNPTIKKHLEDYPSFGRNNQVCPVDTLLLPFFDDFANNNSIYPNCAKWQDNHVFINEAMAIEPPSIGVATFDGLSPDGTPYDQRATPAAGLPADTLTSQHLDLSGLTPTDNIFLSFFLEAEGLGDRPQVQDSFFVEFKDSADVWVTIAQYEGIDDSVSTLALQAFEQIFLPINETRYLYRGFQFRFRNYASITGNNDHWHLDYVYLEDNRTNANPTQNNFGSYADVAYTEPPNTPLQKGYTAMPWRHFAANPIYNDTITLANFNHNPCNTAGTLDRLYEVNEVSPNSTSLMNMPIAALPNYSCSPNSDDVQTYTTTSAWNTIVPTEKTILESKLSILFPTDFQSGSSFAANDTATKQTVLDNYFAYDDGVAEHRAIAQNIGTKVAVEYQAEVADTLRGIYFHLPYLTNRNSEIDFINVKVWLDSLQNEVFSRDFYKLRYEAGFNGFHYVSIEDYTGRPIPIPVQAGQKFYVGWQQASKNEVPIGFDKNNDARDKTFVSGGSVWENSEEKGAVMIRPLLSMVDTFTLIPIEKVETPTVELRIYPNPTQDQIYLELENNELLWDNYQIQVNNVLGQVVYQGDFVSQLSMGDYEKGLYILTLTDMNGKIIAQRKIIKQ